MFELINFIKKNNDWRVILSGAPYFLRISDAEGYTLLKYSQCESDLSLPIVQQARGVIIDSRTLEVVCLPFDKFFNAQEGNAAQIDWESATVSEKIDGSLIKFWFRDVTKDVLSISTNGTINAFGTKLTEDGESFGDIVSNYLNENENYYNFLLQAKRNCTYMFELTCPMNQIVINYGEKTQLTYLGSRDNETGEVFQEDTSLFDIKVPKIFKFDDDTPLELEVLEQYLEYIDNVKIPFEGFVVSDKFGNMIKVKSKEYLRLHYLKANNVLTSERALDIILTGEEEEYCAYFPNYAVALGAMKEKYNNFIINAQGKLARMKDKYETNNYTKKEYAELVISDPMSWVYFEALREDWDIFKILKKKSTKKILEAMEKW